MGRIHYNKGQLYINLWLVSTPLCTNLHVSPFPWQGPLYWGARVSSWRGTTGPNESWASDQLCDHRQVNEYEPQEHQARGANQEATWEQGRGSLRVTLRS